MGGHPDLASTCQALALPLHPGPMNSAALLCAARTGSPCLAALRQAAPPRAVRPPPRSLARSLGISISLSLSGLSLSRSGRLCLSLSLRTHKTFKEQTRPAPPGLRGGALLCVATSDRRDRGNPGNHDRGSLALEPSWVSHREGPSSLVRAAGVNICGDFITWYTATRVPQAPRLPPGR
jgi:hypothetical protein